MNRIKAKRAILIVYEPTLEDGIKVLNEFMEFNEMSQSLKVTQVDRHKKEACIWVSIRS